MSHTLSTPSVLAASLDEEAPAGRASFTVQSATTSDLARRVGLALAVLTKPGDAELARNAAVSVLLTGSTDDAVDLGT